MSRVLAMDGHAPIERSWLIIRVEGVNTHDSGTLSHLNVNVATSPEAPAQKPMHRDAIWSLDDVDA